MITWGGSNYQPHDYVIRRYIRCISAFNDVHGFHENQSPAILKIEAYNNFSYKNGGNGFYIPTTGTELTTNRGLYKSNITYDNNNNFVSNWGHVRDIHIDENNTWNIGFSVSSADFVSLPDSANIVNAMISSRQSDGSLPDLGDYWKLASTSDLIDIGTDVGLPYNGVRPDLGPFEYVAPTTSNVDSLLSLWDSYTTFTPFYGSVNTSTLIDDYNTNWDSIASNLAVLRQVVEAQFETTLTWNTTAITPITFSMNGLAIRTAINANNTILFDNMDAVYTAVVALHAVPAYDSSAVVLLTTPTQSQFVEAYNLNMGLLIVNTTELFTVLNENYGI
jgi:hypothetical protein